MPNPGNILIITNPASNRGRGAKAAGIAAAHLRERGAESVIRETTASGDAERIATEAMAERTSPPRCIVACGGGTALQFIEVQAPGKRPTAYSDFARGHAIAAGAIFDGGRAL